MSIGDESRMASAGSAVAFSLHPRVHAISNEKRTEDGIHTRGTPNSASSMACTIAVLHTESSSKSKTSFVRGDCSIIQ